MTNGEALYASLVEELHEEFPRFRLVQKESSRLHRAIDNVLRVCSFGRIRNYLRGYHTTVGQTVYVTGDWEATPPESRYLTLRHERVHMRQFRRWTFPGMMVLYLLLPLPIGFAYFRYRFERAAYEESVRSTAELFGIERVQSPAYRARIVSHFTEAGYGWMWPFPRALHRWYDTVLGELLAGTDSRH